MKKVFIWLLIISVLLPLNSQAASMAQNLSGRILLQVEENGEAWYVYPSDLNRYYMGRPADAFELMRGLGLGVAHSELQGYLNSTFPARLSGYIVLDVQANGEAYYINPLDLKGYYLGRPADAFSIMRSLGLGINNTDLQKIPAFGHEQPDDQPDQGAIPGLEGPFEVLQVVDGNTLKIDYHGRLVFVNLIGTFTFSPTSVIDYFSCMGAESMAMMEQLVAGKMIYLQEADNFELRDSSEYIWRYVYLSADYLLNEELIKIGAVGYDPDYYHELENVFAAYDEYAEEHELGLNAHDVCSEEAEQNINDLFVSDDIIIEDYSGSVEPESFIMMPATGQKDLFLWDYSLMDDKGRIFAFGFPVQGEDNAFQVIVDIEDVPNGTFYQCAVIKAYFTLENDIAYVRDRNGKLILSYYY